MDETKKKLALDTGLLWLRVLTGAGMVYHGYPKLFGGIMPKLIEGVTAMGFPFPAGFAWAAALAEFAGGLCLIAGFFTRPAAALIFVTMSVAAFITHAADPFNVKELALAYWAASGTLMLTGGGRFALKKC